VNRNVFLPKTLQALWEIWGEYPQAEVYGGGTDLFVKMHARIADPEALICLDRIGALQGVEDRGETVHIGACTSHAHIMGHSIIRKEYPLLCHAVARLGSPPIRHMGTIGGNIVTASPAGDTLPPLYLLNAEVQLASKNLLRQMKLSDFIIGPGRTRLAPQEIVTTVLIPKPRPWAVQHYEKVGLRNALACALVSMAALADITQSGEIREIRLAWGSIGPTVLRFPEVENSLTGKNLSPETLETAADAIRKGVTPIDDVRASAEYRRQVAGNLLLRLLKYAPA